MFFNRTAFLSRYDPHNWNVAACPVNGPALIGNGREVAIAWFTAVGNDMRQRLTTRSPVGATAVGIPPVQSTVWR